MKISKKLLSLFLMFQVMMGNLVGLPAIRAQEILNSEEVSTAENAEDIPNEKIRPKVSVIVPVYNTEPYLGECLDSTKNQTLKEIEIICVDDGSTDNSGKILDEYAANDSRFIVIHQENKGLPMARQAGMDIAKGEYIKHVDSDDYIDLQTLEICYNEAKKDDVDMLVHGAYAFDSEKQWLHSQFKHQLITKQLFNVIGGFGCFLLYKADFLKKNELNFYGVKNMSEDRCFIMKCTPAAKKIKTIPNLLYYYRQHNTSLRATVLGENRAKEHVHNILNIYEYWSKKGYFEQKEARIGFLRDALVWNLWSNDSKICKMFFDTIKSLDESFLTDENIISSLRKRERYRLDKILSSQYTFNSATSSNFSNANSKVPS